MKTTLKILLLLTSILLCQQSHAQSLCYDTTVYLNENGIHILSPQSVLNPSLSDEYEAIVSPSIFTCGNLGKNIVEVYVLFEGDTVYHCFTSVTVKESIKPIARCTTQTHVVFDIMGGYKFTFDELDAGSSSQCGVFGYRIEPSLITCESPNPAYVNLIIRDRSDQYDTCVVEVSWEEHPGPYAPFACRNNPVVESFFGVHHEDEVITVTSSLILEGNPLQCPLNYSVVITENGIPRPKPEITLADTNNILVVTVTELSSGAQCTTPITVVGTQPCEETFFVCDTSSRCAPLGDCNSGHTDLDNIEWPCDITISNACYSQTPDISPEAIQWFHYGDPEDALPTYRTSPTCNIDFLFEGYWDKEIPLPTGKRIERTWTVLNWVTQLTYEYKQVIDIEYRQTIICDTLPWNAPVGDCASGHTLSDNVEWPADITIESFFSHPDDLAQNPEVLPEDVRPQVTDTCHVLTQTYYDEVSALNDSTLLVERNWTLQDILTSESWTYKQFITILFNPNGSLVCVERQPGEPIPDVELIPGVETDATGCYLFENPEGIIVTPDKDSPLQEGITILDEIILSEYLLGLRPLNFFLQYAADLNRSNAVSTIDLIEMRKLREGTLQPVFSSVWKFFEQNTLAGFADISNPLLPYKFIGIKMGDLDHSFVLTNEKDREDMLLLAEDEVLTNGETYLIRFYPDRNDSIVGFAVKIKNENGNIDFLDVISPVLPGFDTSKHVSFDPVNNTVTIEWIAPLSQMENGVDMSLLDPLFFLQLRPNADVLLREELTLESGFDHVLKPRGDDLPLDVHLVWENIINATITLGDGRSISFYPNPSSDVIHIEGLNENEAGHVTITDATGRILMRQHMGSTLDVSALEPGMYYITFTINGIPSHATPLVHID